MCQQGPPDASQGVAQASARRELSHMSPWQSRIRRCGSAKAARKCGEVGSGYTEPKGWVVGSGRKRSRTIQRSAKLWISGHRGRERVGLELLRSRTSEAQGQSTIEPIPVRRNDHRKPNGCDDAADWVDMPIHIHNRKADLVSSSRGQWRVGSQMEGQPERTNWAVKRKRQADVNEQILTAKCVSHKTERKATVGHQRGGTDGSRDGKRGVKIWIRLRGGLERVWFDSLRPRASAARRGMRWVSFTELQAASQRKRSQSLSFSGKCSKLQIGVRVLEPIPVRRNDRQKPNGCNDAVDWVDIANSKLLLAANTESNSTDSAALERPSLPECAYATAAGQLMLPMPYKIAAWILGVVVFVGIGQYLVGPVEAWMRNANVWIAVGFNTTVQLYWDGGLIEHNLAPFRFVIPRDQVVPAA
ncbi:hypothetical protein EDB86DRAFT_2833511 [Lactarius hatsudake]|nr:hypothetical protein EDB86DRAFT_2833511 [Lactarius hatsudake]